MTCPTCRDSGHRPDAPWLLCPAECEAVQKIRARSAAARLHSAPNVLTDRAVPPGEIHFVSGGQLVRMLGVRP